MDNLITLYQQRFKLEKAIFSRIEHEDALVAIVYKITRASGKQQVLKICTRDKDYFNELYFLNYFAHKLPVPIIIDSVDPEPNVKGAILMECLDGSTLKNSDLTGPLAFQMGSLLARIHLNRTDGYGDLTKLDDLSSDPRFYFTQKFNEVLKECSDNLPKEMLEKCRSYFDSHINLLKFVDGPCITHRDFRPGNVMAYNDKIQGIIDWSAARASFAEEDFCGMEHSEWSVNPASKKSFLEGYASIRLIPDYSSIMPLLRMCKALDIIGFTVKRKTWNSSGANLYRMNRKYLEKFFKQI